jgi:type I restriction-modification system DNA methylase subunit
MALEPTQVTFASEVAKWIDEIVKKNGLRFDTAQVEVKEVKTRRRADIILWESQRAKKPALLIEIWDPQTNPWDEDILYSVHGKATNFKVRYFAIWNITHFYCFDTYLEGDYLDKLWFPHAGVPETVTSARNYAETLTKEAEIRSFLELFLKEFEQVYYGIKPKPPLGIDERFIYRLRGTIHSFALPLLDHIKKMYRENPVFRKRLVEYFREQAWTFKGSDEDFEKVARQYAYLLVVKMLFYDILASTPQYSKLLRKLTIPATRLSGEELKSIINNYLEEAHRVTGAFEVILFSNFLDSIPPPDAIVDQVRSLASSLAKYDFSKVSYEILGNVFQRLIPEEERHKLGQYFTRSDVVDLIVSFCVRKPDDKVLDGSCGAGTFLVRAYVRKKLLNPRKTHEELINELYGVDIAKFPALLSMVNLASRDLSRIGSAPNIIHRDFFDVAPGGEYPATEVRGNRVRVWHVKVPERFDAVVMNPPYTRQEEMEDILEEEKGKAYERCIRDWIEMSGNRYVDKKPKVSKRSSIYVYFFIHGGLFLREGGRMGLVTSNSWLDVDYGGDLQRYFLENFRIIAIIESKVERWFEDADINTVITIVERCSDPEERDNNVVKFVLLKKPLTDFIPPTENEEERWRRVEELVKLVESTNTYYEDNRIRIFPKKQRELWEEGYDEEERDYVGSKWGKYLRAPQIFFKILEKGRGKLVPLREVAEVRFGIKTGANEFFYLTKEEVLRKGIEREFWMHPIPRKEWDRIKDLIPEKDVWIDRGGNYFKQSQYAGRYRPEDILIDGNVIWIPNYMVKSPREGKSILLNPRDLKHVVLLIHRDKDQLRGTNVLKHIELGERQGFHTRPTCKSRRRWYELDEIRGTILTMMSLNDRHIFWLNNVGALIDARLYGITPKPRYKDMVKLILAALNSTVTYLLVELSGRLNLGQGALDVKVYEYGSVPIVDPALLMPYLDKVEAVLNEASGREMGSVFEELGASLPDEVSLDKVKPDRRELDEIVMGKILGLTEEEKLEVYRAVVDLVRSRIERARSSEAEKKRRKKEELDALVDLVVGEIKELYSRELEEIKKFPEAYVSSTVRGTIVEVPRTAKAVACYNLVEGAFVDYGTGKLKFRYLDEAEYVALAVLAGKTKVVIPEDRTVLIATIERQKKLLEELRSKIDEHLKQAIPDKKLRERARPLVLKKLFGVETLEHKC